MQNYAQTFYSTENLDQMDSNANIKYHPIAFDNLSRSDMIVEPAIPRQPSPIGYSTNDMIQTYPAPNSNQYSTSNQDSRSHTLCPTNTMTWMSSGVAHLSQPELRFTEHLDPISLPSYTMMDSYRMLCQAHLQQQRIAPPPTPTTLSDFTRKSAFHQIVPQQSLSFNPSPHFNPSMLNYDNYSQFADHREIDEEQSFVLDLSNKRKLG